MSLIPFLQNFERLLTRLSNLNPNLAVLLGDVNAKSTSWWVDDKTNPEEI